MSKTIDSVLLAHKALPTTTLCRLLKVKCKDGTLFGFANFDSDLVYDDNSGDGAITYRSNMGMTPTRSTAATSTTVDNLNVSGVVADLETLGITEAQARAGKLDFAQGWVYEVNWNDLTTGRHEIKARGNLGRASMRDDEFDDEFLSLTQKYKQAIGQVTSITCRAEFGSMPIGTGGEQPEHRYPCGKSWSWAPFTITSVDPSEPDRIITAAALSGATDFYTPGVMRVTSGPNQGFECEVEVFTSGGVMQLSMPAWFPFAVDDEGEIRQDCSKLDDDADHGCVYHWGADWPLHFRGESLLKHMVGKEGELSTPGAEL